MSEPSTQTPGVPAEGNARHVLMAPHDDGFGAYATLAQLALAMLNRAASLGVDLHLTFLWGFPGFARTEDARRVVATDFAGFPRTPQIFWHPNINLYENPKDPDRGAVDLGRIEADVFPRIDDGQAMWRQAVAKAGFSNWANLDLVISMGVPWLHTVARHVEKERGRPLPSLEIGDTCPSLILRGNLELGNRLTHGVEALCREVATHEHRATEAWLLPLATPPEYVNHFAAGGVPVNWLPGLFGPDRATIDDQVAYVRGVIDASRGTPGYPLDTGQAIVGIHAGRTSVWDGIAKDLAAEARPHGAFVLATGGRGTLDLLGRAPPAPGGRLWPIEGIAAKATALNQPFALFGAQDLAMSRGGITALEHIVAGCPVAVVDEPNHWLGHHQQRALAQAGLCIPVPLDTFRANPMPVIRNLLTERQDDLKAIRRRTRGIWTGADRWLADYLLQAYLA